MDFSYLRFITTVDYRIFIRTLSLYISVFTLFFLLSTQTTMADVIQTHPRIFLTPDIITQLQNKKNDNTLEWQRVEDRLNAISNYTGAQLIADYIEEYEYLMTAALGYYATGNQTYMDKA